MIFHPLLDLLGQNNVHHNTDDDYDYEKCITKVIADHLKSVNSDVLIVDVAMDTTTDRIKELVNKENK